jgi:ABC-2 type transport system ATP-binding protein
VVEITLSPTVTMASSPPAVAARDLEYRYGDRMALDGVDFSVEPGEIFGFLGPNGGGKTTLFQIMATLRKPAAGRMEIFGCDAAVEAALVRLQLGVVFQSPSLDPELTVQENLLHHGHLYGMRGSGLRRQIDLQLDRFGLRERRRDRVKALSGGLSRRVEIAKSLLHGPRLLLLDEPSSGLDPGARRDLWYILEELRGGRRVTILLTTHFMEEGDRCDRVALVDEGRIVASGPPVDLKEEIGGDVVLLDSADPVALCRDLRNRFGLDASLHEGVVRFEQERAHELVGKLAESLPGRIDAMTVSKPTLEDVFLHRTGRGLWEER